MSDSTVSIPLEVIRIASPCTASWDKMQGDDKIRFCSECRMNVYNLSAMTRDEAQQLVGESSGRLCVRLYKRHDGTVLTADCPIGRWQRARTWTVRTMAAAWGVAACLLGLNAMRVDAHVDWRPPSVRRMLNVIRFGLPPKGATPVVMGDLAVPQTLMGKPANPTPAAMGAMAVAPSEPPAPMGGLRPSVKMCGPKSSLEAGQKSERVR